MITLQYAITKEDYVNYHTYVMWDAPQNRKKKINYYIRQIIPLVLFIIAFYYTGIFERNSKFIILILGFIFLTSLLSLFNVRSNTVKQAEKITNDPNNSSIFHDTSMMISETGISTKDALAETKFQWEAFLRFFLRQNDKYRTTNFLQDARSLHQRKGIGRVIFQIVFFHLHSQKPV